MRRLSQQLSKNGTSEDNHQGDINRVIGVMEGTAAETKSPSVEAYRPTLNIETWTRPCISWGVKGRGNSKTPEAKRTAGASCHWGSGEESQTTYAFCSLIGVAVGPTRDAEMGALKHTRGKIAFGGMDKVSVSKTDCLS